MSSSQWGAIPASHVDLCSEELPWLTHPLKLARCLFSLFRHDSHKLVSKSHLLRSEESRVISSPLSKDPGELCVRPTTLLWLLGVGLQ